MKFISLIILFAALAITKIGFKGDTSMPQSIHADIQNDVKGMIISYVKESLPNSSNIKFQKIWTERINKNKIKAVFKYSFNDHNTFTDKTQTAINGYAYLTKDKEKSNKENEIWNFDSLKITDNVIEYKNGIKIKSGE